MRTLLAAIKFVLFGMTVLAYFISTLPLFFFLKRYSYRVRGFLIRMISFHGSYTIQNFGIQMEIENIERLVEDKGPFLIVSNHLTYIDVILIASLKPACFITSLEMKKAPILGQITQVGGCLYVDRKSRNNLSDEIQDITQALKNGLSVVVFAEATSTDGSEVKRFRSPLFQSAIDANVSILPITINYTHVDQVPLSSKNRDSVFWYGDMGFLNHFWRFLKNRKIGVTVSIHQKMAVDKSNNNKELAELTHSIVKAKYRPIS